MNVYELDTLSLQYIRRPPDNDARNELSQFFVTAYNEIYRRIMSEAYRISVAETTELDENKCFSVGALSKTLLSIKNIYDACSDKLLWERSTNDNIKVHTSAKSVTVVYYYMPELLENTTPTTAPGTVSPNNTPCIPQEYHNIFSLWAAYRYLHSRRKFEDANYYYEMAIELMHKISNDFAERTKLKINYLN